MFAYTNRHQVKLWVPPRKVVERQGALLSQRQRMMKSRKQLATANSEQKLFTDKEIMHSLNVYTNRTVSVIDKQIKAIENEILSLIKEDEKLKQICDIMTSVNQNMLYERNYWYKFV